MLKEINSNGNILTLKCNTVWPEILAGNLFWRIGGFERNPPIFPAPNCSHYDVIITDTLLCDVINMGPPSFKLRKNGMKIVHIWST